MPEPLSLAVAQPLCLPYDVTTNALTHAATVRSAGTRVVVFLELSLTGYELDAEAISANDSRLLPLIEACAQTGSVTLVGAPLVTETGRPFIAILAVESTGVRVAYRKMYLGESEKARFGSGSSPAVFDVDGWRLGLAICKDTGTPRHAADTVALGIDAYVAGTLMSDDETGLQNERGRRLAAKHQVWVAFASFAGSTGDGYERAAGCSAIWTPDADLAAQAGHETGTFARVMLTGAQRR